MFINPHNEDFDKKLEEYNKNAFENILIQKYISENKELILNILNEEKDDIDIKDINSFQIFHKIIIKLYESEIK